MDFTIKNPIFINQKNGVRFTLVNPDGIESIAEFTIPESRARGLNKYWDYIMDNFDIELMRNQFNTKVDEEKRRNEHRHEKQKAEIERARLKQLFDEKAKVFELPFVAQGDIDTKAAIRRAPNLQILSLITQDIVRNFMKDNNMSHSDYLDYLDDLEDELND